MNESWLRQHPALVVVGILASIALSAWALAVDDIINNDGVHYVLTAEQIARGEWAEALVTFKWPAYSFLIYLVAQLPGIDVALAAHVVTTAGFTAAVLGFVAVVHALGGRGRVLWLALAVVLAFPGINEIRSYMIRDAVFFALYLFALAALMRYVADGGRLRLAACAAALLAASLFRVEALMLALALPVLVVIGGGRRPRCALRMSGYLLLIAPVLALFYGWWIFRPEDGEAAWTGLTEPWRVFSLSMDQVGEEIRANLLAEGLDDDGAGFLAGFGMAVSMVVRQTLETLSLPYAVIVLVEALRRRLLGALAPGQRRVLVAMLVLHLVALVVFAAVKFFLAPRYPVALALTLMLTLPFVFDRYWTAISAMRPAWKGRLAGGALGLLLVANTVEGLDNFTEKRYLRDGGQWLAAHAGADYRLATNDLKFAYYAGRYGEKWVVFREDATFRAFLNSGRWRWKDYVAVNVSHRDPALAIFAARALDQEPVRVFTAGNGDRLLIYYTGDD